MDRVVVSVAVLGLVILLLSATLEMCDPRQQSEPPDSRRAQAKSCAYGEARTSEPRRVSVHTADASVPRGLGGDEWTFLEGPGRVLDPVLINLGTSSERPAPHSPEGIATRVLESSAAAAAPPPPSFHPLPEHLPQRLWSPTWRGIAPFYAEHKCPAFRPVPRLWALSLNELQQARARDLGQTQLVEPVAARQSFVQLLSEGWRSRKDKYTRATPSNDPAQNVCAELRRADFISE